MLSSPGSPQVRVTEVCDAVADKPVGLSGAGAAGMSMWNQRERSLVPAPLIALMR